MHKIATVIGTTGVGKSQLAVELCKALCGQVINADSMQVYKGLDIITNKMPVHERQDIPHYLMDFLEPEEEYKVTDFQNDATRCIEDLSAKKQLPVVVGGTNYYIQSLLWHSMLITDQETQPKPTELDHLDTQELLTRLQKVDPIMANRWHPSDRRKIIRSLQIYYQTGRPQSEIIKEQQEHHERHGVQARFKSLIFWLYADPSKLNPRLDDRVDTMIKDGLFDEIKSLKKQVVDGQVKLPGQDLEKYQRGLWQAIGYKEFDPYFSAIEQDTHGEKELDKIRNECTERMKSATRRYAKRQVQWIRNKLLPIVAKSKDVDIYLLDATDLDTWETNVRLPAIQVAEAFHKNETMPDPLSLSSIASTMLSPSSSRLDSQTRVLTWQKHTCSVCKAASGESLIVNGDLEWKQHLSSRGHRAALKRQNNATRNQATTQEKRSKINDTTDE
ncbi:trna isopentenyltransferase [Lichtheimia corymbifera JMRC:FSU:9682]|uniref:tRNA dimethylallyltransferase n=1 Tax=Lichtheimia corymbifera JMRC:FSU:9682 TaxID=1263082 RepID=A0A068S3U9_9FUNG|nr:trna isopentenyltransferase [Lichtheimia corymbifera JMRC:FSU:9682]